MQKHHRMDEKRIKQFIHKNIKIDITHRFTTYYYYMKQLVYFMYNVINPVDIALLIT